MCFCALLNLCHDQKTCIAVAGVTKCISTLTSAVLKYADSEGSYSLDVCKVSAATLVRIIKASGPAVHAVIIDRPHIVQQIIQVAASFSYV